VPSLGRSARIGCWCDSSSSTRHHTFIIVPDLLWSTALQRSPSENRRKAAACYRSDFPEVLARVAAWNSQSRIQALAWCRKVITTPTLRNHEPTRVAAAKLLVALLPASMQILKWSLRTKRPKSTAEVHFSLMCYLDQVQYFKALKPTRKSVLLLVKTYLMHTEGDDALACWMAADLLGEHWSLRESLVPLLTAAKDAKHPAARVEAVGGLGKAFARSSASQQARIRRALLRLTREGTAKAVRAASSAVLQANGSQTACTRPPIMS